MAHLSRAIDSFDDASVALTVYDLSVSNGPDVTENSERKLVSIVVPFYNEGSGVERLHQALASLFDGMSDIDFELIAVDDGSADDTLRRLIACSERDSRIVVIELSRNFGKEAALTAGIDAARGDAIVPFDADLQDPPDLIAKLIAEWRAGADVVLARRADRSSDSLAKRKSAAWFYRLHNMISSVKIPENVGDFRLLDRLAVDALRQLPERQRFMKGLFAWIGFRTTTIDYVRQPRETGQSKFSGFKLWNLALEGITSFSTAPLKIWTYVGAIGALATFVYATFIIVRVLLLGIDLPGYASLLVAVLFLGSLQLLSVGLLGEYIGRIYLESKQRPTYVVRRRYGNRK